MASAYRSYSLTPPPQKPFVHWFLKQGGLYSKNKMPRGRRFKKAVEDYHNGSWEDDGSGRNRRVWKGSKL